MSSKTTEGASPAPGERAAVYKLFPSAYPENVNPLKVARSDRPVQMASSPASLHGVDRLPASGLFDAAEAQSKHAEPRAPESGQALAGPSAVANERGVAGLPKRPQDRTTTPAIAAPIGYDDPFERVVAAEFDATFYLDANSDILSDGIDPVHHYTWWGWREQRNPNSWFDTAYYLESNPDIEQSDINPFWHYLVAGRAEGRRSSPPGGFQWAIIEAAREPAEISADYSRVLPEGLLAPERLAGLLRDACRETQGFVLSVGHDRYTTVTGGVQIFIADEQASFARLGMAYLNISPYFPEVRLADGLSGERPLNIIIDGHFAGVAAPATVIHVLAKHVWPSGIQRLMVVHCLLGHQIATLTGLQAALAAQQSFFWVHDYSSLCSGYALLRNDAVFCNAPPPGSTACQICVYGPSRAEHLASVHALFTAIPFDVVAPSATALAVWQSGPRLPHLSTFVQEHCRLVPRAAAPRAAPRSIAELPVRVAFIGHQRSLKGGPIWRELVSKARRTGAYQFLNLSTDTEDRAVDGVEHHTAATSAAARNSMTDTLIRLEVDLVVVPSIWPETFSYVTHEALAAGADIVCLAVSGHVAATTKRLGRGFVADDPAALIDFFVSLAAMRHVQARRASEIMLSDLVQCGTTAAVYEALHGSAMKP